MDNLCKTPCKSTSKTRANFSVNLLMLQKAVYKSHFPLAFPPFSTNLHTFLLPLRLINLFHYSTGSTITTINNLIERI